MAKLIINLSETEQKLIEVSEGGYYSDASKVLWDDRLDGLIDVEFVKENLGGLVKDGAFLKVNAAKLSKAKAEQAAKKAELEQKEIIEAQKKADQIAAKKSLAQKINAIDNINDVKNVLKDFVKALRADE